MITKCKGGFKKMRLTARWASMDNYSKICWFITLIWDSGQA